MKTLKLKACPFCGSEANQPEDVSVPKYGPWWQVMCSNEQCRAWRPGASPAKAAAEWNKRAGDRQPATPDEAKGIVPFASASVMPRPEDFPQRKPGEPVRLNWKKQVLRFACCDCALVHNIKFAVKGDRLTLRAYRNKRLTAHFRKTTGKDAWGDL